MSNAGKYPPDPPTILMSSTEPTELLPSFIGQYRVLSRLGEGGMGEVFLCEQIQPIRRRVAVKVLKRGMQSQRIVERFMRERRILALMAHTNVARMLDAGETEDRRPFFVLEYVRGVPILEYCHVRKLELSQRLQLFLQVCAAVQHAHEKGVIHRDLKPGNILVTDSDGLPQSKIIDFGISRVFQRYPGADTALREMTGSPEYMSPEQAGMGPDQHDTRSDIYSLGVVLYQLLTNSVPFTFNSDSFLLADLQRLLEKTPVPSAATRVLELDDVEHAQHCGLGSPSRLARQLRGDLDWILMKAMEKDPSRRYATAADLAEDITCYINRQPVSAARPSTFYALRKFSQRHAMVVAVSIVLSIALLGFSSYSVWQAFQLDTERDRANRETRKAEEIAEFMVSVLALGDPISGDGSEVTLRHAVEIGRKKIAEKLADQPETQIELLYNISKVYGKMGLYEEAVDAASEALEHVPENDINAFTLISSELGNALRHLERYEDARKIYENALAALADTKMEGTQVHDAMKFGIAMIAKNEGDLKTAGMLFSEVAEALSARGDAGSALYGKTLNELGQNAFYQGNLGRAENMLKQAVAIMSKTAGPAAFETAQARGWLMHVLSQQNKHEEAEAIGRANIAMLLEVYGEDHELVARAYNNLAMIVDHIGKDDEAERYYFKALEYFTRTRSSNSDTVLTLMGNIGAMYLNAGRYVEAERIYRDATDKIVRTTGEQFVKAADFELGLSFSLSMLGRAEEALAFADRAFSPYREHFGEGTWPMGYAHEVRGTALFMLGQLEEARSEIDMAERVYVDQLGAEHDWSVRLRKTSNRLAEEERRVEQTHQ